MQHESGDAPPGITLRRVVASSVGKSRIRKVLLALAVVALALAVLSAIRKKREVVFADEDDL
ncbi:hypothetical protein BH24CHL10_BH24CHL10_08210 [soil metagenome]